MCLFPGSLLPDPLGLVILDGWVVDDWVQYTSRMTLCHPLMVTISWVTILVGDTVHTALLLVMDTQEPKVSRDLLSSCQYSNRAFKGPPPHLLGSYHGSTAGGARGGLNDPWLLSSSQDANG